MHGYIKLQTPYRFCATPSQAPKVSKLIKARRALKTSQFAHSIQPNLPCAVISVKAQYHSKITFNMEDTSLNTSVILMTIPNRGDRSISPLTPSPSRELRGVRLFRAISRKLGRKTSTEDLSYTCEEDSRSSSTDSCSSTNGRTSRSKKLHNGSSCSTSPNHLSSSGSDTSSETHNCTSVRHRHHHSTSSFRKVFQSLSITNRSLSCTNGKDGKKKSKKNAPKRILRPPVTYTYVRGLSGLPTQRIPRNTTRILGQNNCACVSNNGYISGLNR